MKIPFSLSIIALLFLSISCKEDPPAPEPEPVTANVFIGNEGFFTAGTGTLSSYSTSSKGVEHNLYLKANSGPMGNTLNSILVEDGEIYMVMNGSAEVVIVDAATSKLVRRVGNVPSPRHIIKGTENKMYITDWQEGGVIVFNRNTGKIVRTITTGVAPEKMLVKDNLLFVANGGGSGIPDSTVTVINTDNDSIVTTLFVGDEPHSMQLDADDKLWILCSGVTDFANPFLSTSGSLESFDLSIDSLEFYIDTLKQVDSLVFADNQIKPTHLEIDAAGKTLFFLDNSYQGNLMKFDIEGGILPTNPFVIGNFYGLGMDQVNDEIYVSDPLDYTVNGVVKRYATDGQQIDQFKVGLIPGSFGFR